MESQRQPRGRPCLKLLVRLKIRFLESAPARFHPSKIVRNDDKWDLARIGLIPTAERALDFGSIPDSHTMLDFGGSKLFGGHF